MLRMLLYPFQITALVIASATASASPDAGNMSKPSHPDSNLWQQLLTRHVQTDGGVDYLGFKKDEVTLNQFLSGYENYGGAHASVAKRTADYINFYNAGMVEHILRYAKEKSIDLASPAFLQLEINQLAVGGGNIWQGSYSLAFAGQRVTLDDIEHKLLRGQAPGSLQDFAIKELDPRIHAAVNCAALSCPRVREHAYTESNVEAMLEENMRNFISDQEQFRKTREGTMAANSIVFWYYSDFDDYAQSKLKLKGAGSYLSTFLTADAIDREWKAKHLQENFDNRNRLALKLSSAFAFHYRWQINDRRNKKGS